MKKTPCFVQWGFLVSMGSLLLVGCAPALNFSPESSSDRFMPSFFSRLKEGDRHVGWALTYFESWQRGQQPRYLFLAEDHINTAVNEFAALQADTSPRINEFYVVRERRVRSCRFLAELKFTATNYGLALQRPIAAGCVF